MTLACAHEKAVPQGGTIDEDGGLGLLLAASALPAAAQDKPVNLKVSIWLPPAHPLVPATKA